MNFFEHQAQARASSSRLILLFGLAVLFIVLGINVVVLASLGLLGPALETGYYRDLIEVAGLVTLVTVTVIVVASLYKQASLRSGGGAIAASLGGRLVPPDTTDFHLRRLRNVVEEMAIASGTPVPAIYVLEEEPGINAFAAGFSTADAAIAVTRGALDKLSRDELQGVVAHEFSHILNGDMRLNLQLVGVLFGILVLALVARKLLEHGRSARRETAALMVIALGTLVVGYIGLFFGRLIKASVSRQREFLADASAVQFTRQASGIAGALKKIAGFGSGSKLIAADAEQSAHMLFGDGVGYSALFATHPPVLERISRLEPSFAPEQLNRLAAVESQLGALAGAEEPLSALALIQGTAPRAPGAARLVVPTRAPSPARPPPLPARVSVAPAQVVAKVGAPLQEHIDYAHGLHTALPGALLDAAHAREGSVDVVLGLLLDAESGLRARQLELIGRQLGVLREQSVSALQPLIAELHPAHRLPLATIAFGAIRGRPQVELLALRRTIEALIHLDGRLEVFEYCIGRSMADLLQQYVDPTAREHGSRSLTDLAGDVGTLLAVLADRGHPGEPETGRRAFQRGMQHVLPRSAVVYGAPEDWAAALDHALVRLRELDPLAKQTLIEALVHTLEHDGRVTVVEAELLRAICLALRCPLPPLLAAQPG